MSTDDFFLRDTIALAVEKAFNEVEPGPGFQGEFADRILAAIAERGQRWAATKQDRWLEAATAFGDRDAHHKYACPHCIRQTQRRLRELETYARLLTGWFVTPTRSGDPGPHRPGYHSQPPADLTVITLLDRRSRSTAVGDDDEPSPQLSIPGTTRHLADWLLDEYRETRPRRRSLTGDIAYILSQVDRAANDTWIEQLAKIVATIWRQARGGAHDRPPPPAGDCLTVGCGGVVYRVFIRDDEGGDGARCGTCRRVYRGRDLIRLGVAQDAT